MTEAFRGRELSKSDIQGVAAYIEVGLGAIAAGGATLMFLGLNPVLILTSIANPGFAHLLTVAIEQAPAILVMWGAGMGPQVGGGISVLLGQLH